MKHHPLLLGDTRITPHIVDGLLHSLGSVQIGPAQLRNPATRFLPWFDTFAGDVFRKFEVLGVEQRGDDTLLATRAYWSNHSFSSKVTQDVPSEVRLEPKEWGTATVE